MPSAAKIVIRVIVALALGGLIYWVAETAALATHVMAITQIAVWLSPISIFGWLALAALIAAAYVLAGKLPGLSRSDGAPCRGLA